MKNDLPYKLRKIGKRDTRKFVVIVCEGRQTEKKYFERFNERYSGVKVEPIHGKCTDAKNIVDFAEQQIKDYPLDLNDGDEIWCAFDVDQKEEQTISNAVVHAKTKKIKIALSNPCIELWFLLHYKKISAPITYKDTFDELQTFIKDYSKNKEVFEILKDKLPLAIKNAESLNVQHESKGVLLLSKDSNPSTQIFQLIRTIQNLIQKNTIN